MTKKPDPDQDIENTMRGLTVMLEAMQRGMDPTEAIAEGLRANGRQVTVIDMPAPKKG